MRARDGAVAYEIGARQYGPLLGTGLLDALTDLMVARLDGRRERAQSRSTLATRIRATLFG